MYRLDLNFSLDAILLIYMNKINSPPMNIKNVISAIHDDTIIFEINIVEMVVYKISIIPIDIGVLRVKMINEIAKSIFINKNLMSVGILIKILVLGTIDVEESASLKF